MRFPALCVALLLPTGCVLDWQLRPEDGGFEQAEAGIEPAAPDAAVDAAEDAAPTPPSVAECLIDSDEDGFGAAGRTHVCPAGQTPDAVLPGDCDDRLAAAYPGNAEVCGDGIDNDCSGQAEDLNQAESCNGGDDDCDGSVDEGFAQPSRAQVWTQPELTVDSANLPAAVTALLPRAQGGGWLMYEATVVGSESEPWVFRLDGEGGYAGGARIEPRRADGGSVWANTLAWRASASGRWIAVLAVRPGFYPRSFDLYVQLFRADDFGFVSELLVASEGEADALMPLALSVLEGAQGHAHLLSVYARSAADTAAATQTASVRYAVAAFRDEVWEQPARRDLIPQVTLPVFLPDASLARVPCREEWLVRGTLYGAEPGNILQRVRAGTGAIVPLGLAPQTTARNLSFWEGEERCRDGLPAPELLFADRQVDSYTLGRLLLDRESGTLKEGDTLPAPTALEAHQSQGRWFYATLSADSLYALYELDWTGKQARPIAVSSDVSIGVTHPLATVGRQLFDFMTTGGSLIAVAANSFNQSNLDAQRSSLLPNPGAPAAAVTYTLSCAP